MLSRYGSKMESQWLAPLYTFISGVQFLMASASLPGMCGSCAILVMGSKYVRTVKRSAPDFGNRRRVWRSERKWRSWIVRPVLSAAAQAIELVRFQISKVWFQIPNLALNIGMWAYRQLPFRLEPPFCETSGDRCQVGWRTVWDMY